MSEVDKINEQIAALTAQRESVMLKERANVLAKMKADLPTAQQNLSQPYNGAVSRLNNASFGVKSHTFGGDNSV